MNKNIETVEKLVLNFFKPKKNNLRNATIIVKRFAIKSNNIEID